MNVKNCTTMIGIILVSILYFNMVSACFNPTDSFATEVLLNKDSISYDLSGIKEAENVKVIEKEEGSSEEAHKEEIAPKPTKTENGKEPSSEDYIETNAIIYRSHYNKDVAVILTEEEWRGQKYLDVKIQMPTKLVHSSHYELRINLDTLPPITQEIDKEYLESLGYIVEGGFQDDCLRSHLIKGNICIAVLSINDIEEEEEDDEDHEKRKSFSEISIRIENQNTLTPELKEEFKNVLRACGFSPDLLDQAEIKTETREDVDLVSAIDIDLDSFDWGMALKTELEWLQNNNVISGLTDEDLDGIAKVADKGTAGWNSKIRYFKGKWVQGITEEMSEETGIYMVKSLGDCNGFPIENLPEGVLEIDGRSQVSNGVDTTILIGIGIVVVAFMGVAFWIKRR
ncbi:MAG: hypothetical protein J7J21_03540 [Methanomicrobia archaeon]|nr:hypothetical protein [Methanomicrobia archaeon]